MPARARSSRYFLEPVPRRALSRASCWSPSARSPTRCCRSSSAGSSACSRPRRRAQLFAEHGPTLALMLAVVLLRPVFFVARRAGPQPRDHARTSSTSCAGRATGTSSGSPGPSSRTTSPAASATRCMQAGEAIEMAVNLTIDAVWYAAVFVVGRHHRAGRHRPGAAGADRASGSSPTRVLFRWTMPRIDPHSEEVSEATLGDDRPDGRQLHQHPDAEDLRRRRRGGRLRRGVGRRRTSASSAG